MQSRNYQNFQTRVKVSKTSSELNIQEEKITCKKVSQKIQNMNVEIAKITSNLESLKRHSDCFQQEISTSQERDTDIENI